MLDLAKELKKEGCGTIIVTHNLQHIFSIVDRITETNETCQCKGE